MKKNPKVSDSMVKNFRLPKQAKDLTGQRFCRLLALEPVAKSQDHAILWKCLCDCGNFCIVRSSSLLAGQTKSCGCLQKETVANRLRTHGMSQSLTYFIWQSMIQRCENPNNRAFKNYGGRGIKVCKKWHRFENFFEDMEACPLGKTLDRIDNDGNYEFGNCKWSTRHEQRINQRVRKDQRWFRAWKQRQMCQFMSNNQRQFARDHNLDNRHISSCLNGRLKSHKGWIFMYCPDPDYFCQDQV